MSFTFPWDRNVEGVKTRLVETDDEHGYVFEFKGENSEAEAYRSDRRVDGSHGYGPTRELREVAFMSNAEALTFWQLTGINPYDPNNAQGVVDFLNQRDFSRLKTIDGGIGRVFKD